MYVFKWLLSWKQNGWWGNHHLDQIKSISILYDLHCLELIGQKVWQKKPKMYYFQMVAMEGKRLLWKAPFHSNVLIKFGVNRTKGLAEEAQNVIVFQWLLWKANSCYGNHHFKINQCANLPYVFLQVWSLLAQGFTRRRSKCIFKLLLWNANGC